MFITGPQMTSQSTTLLSPPQLTGEQHAYIPYKVAKETIAKVIITVEEIYKGVAYANNSFITSHFPACRFVMR